MVQDRIEQGRRPRPRKRVLVVCQDPTWLASAAGMLCQEYNIVVTASARQAAQHIASGARFHLILCDLEGPEYTGKRLFDFLTRDVPPLAARIVFMANPSFTPQARMYLDRLGLDGIEGDLTGRELRDAVRIQLMRLGPV